MIEWRPAYVGLGSNLGDSAARVREAFDRLASLQSSRLVARSSLYRTPPFGPVVQPDFTNAVAGLLTTLEPHVLLDALREIERSMGRTTPRERWGPREIDLDLLVYSSISLADERLTVPHPGLIERAFVLVPLAEIAPALFVPGKARVAELLRRVDSSVIIRMRSETARA